MSLNLFLHKNTAFALFEINTLKATDAQLQEISSELGLGLNLQEMKAIQAYFKTQKQKPHRRGTPNHRANMV